MQNCDGILGLAPEGATNHTSFIAGLKSSGIITKKLIGIYIGHL
jgi:hypothetical protein